jgi:hypothetical protein
LAVGGSAPALSRIVFSMTASMSGLAAAPLGDFTLKPLSGYGLCDAVIMIPQAAPRSTTSYEVIWVGTAVWAIATGMS